MNIRNIKYGISAACITVLVLLTSGCKLDRDSPGEISDFSYDILWFVVSISTCREINYLIFTESIAASKIHHALLEDAIAVQTRNIICYFGVCHCYRTHSHILDGTT